MALTGWTLQFSSLMVFYSNYRSDTELDSWSGLYTGPVYIVPAAMFTSIVCAIAFIPRCLLIFVQVLLGDAIVLWRACVIWSYSRHIVWLSVILLVVTTGELHLV